MNAAQAAALLAMTARYCDGPKHATRAEAVPPWHKGPRLAGDVAPSHVPLHLFYTGESDNNCLP
jgi:hypothetical protein